MALVPFSPNKKTKPISDMPEDVIEKIFSFLPFKKLCSLCIVSKRFRNSWKFCRDLSFDSDVAKNLSRDEYRNMVDNFFNNHSSSCADRLKLQYDASDESNLISFWVGKAIRLGIKELELNLTQTHEKLSLNYDLVDVETLKTLKLVNCELHLPLNSNGLRHLREMTLQNVMAPPMVTDSIFRNCVSLRVLRLVRCSLVYSVRAIGKLGFEVLVVKDCCDVHSIEIDSPCLRRFHYHGKIMELRFGCEMQCLSDVVLDVAHPRGFHRLSPSHRQMVERLAFVQIFTVTTIFLEGLCARFEKNEYKKMEFLLRRLKEFHLVVAPESFLNPSDVAIFIKKCPSIEKLFIDLGRDAFATSLYWNNYGKNYVTACQATFPFLKYVKIKGFTMRELPMHMARFFLKNAINLNRLILVKARIHYFSTNYSPENLRWGIISNAKIEMYNYRADKNTIMPQHLRGV
ncbi:putative FBD-associated F-box protein At1g61330 [Salvia miltiorrhiza]|uniref:putative FBD-associated F-box protein At1g61330 n=1 Tax=Salvia miltiorrhiza TaxID=226208 RepID=UPI0025ACB1AF|nr:putative FBD-associated F-box protein At1g61330 [Salvia miltiorrhiza]